MPDALHTPDIDDTDGFAPATGAGTERPERLPPTGGPIELERTFAFLFEQLNVNGTADHINRFVQAPLQHHAALKPVLVAAADDPDAGE